MWKNDYEKTTNLPTAEEFVALRLAAGLSPRSIEKARIGLSHSDFFIGLRNRDNGQLIAMGRVVGDGATTFEIVDVAVLPVYQRQGLGQAIMDEIMTYLSSFDGAAVSLIADGDAKKLYAKFGFKETAPFSVGMALRIGSDDKK